MIAYNLARAVGALATPAHAKARTITIRNRLINIPARICDTALIYTLHLPHSRRENPFMTMFNGVQTPPAPPDLPKKQLTSRGRAPLLCSTRASRPVDCCGVQRKCGARQRAHEYCRSGLVGAGLGAGADHL